MIQLAPAAGKKNKSDKHPEGQSGKETSGSLGDGVPPEYRGEHPQHCGAVFHNTNSPLPSIPNAEAKAVLLAFSLF